MRDIIRALHTQFAHRFKPDVLALLSDLVPRAVLSLGSVNDLVVDVRDVRGQAHLQTRIREVSAQDVVYEGGSAMAQVRRSVHGGAAQIDADLAWLAHGKRFHALRGGVIEVQHSDKPTI